MHLNISHWTQDSRHRRWLLVGACVLVMAQVAGVVVAVVATTQVNDLTFPDRLAEIGDWLVGGTLTLAATAGVVAVLAYAAATGVPDLKFQLSFPGCAPNQPVLLADVGELGMVTIRRGGNADGSIVLHNLSTYSARNPVVVIRFNNCGIKDNEFSNPGGIWAPIERGTLGIAAIQWDGGSNYSIHGQLKRVVPIHVHSLTWLPPEIALPSLTVQLLAEGYVRSEIDVQLRVQIHGKPPPPSPGPPPPEWH